VLHPIHPSVCTSCAKRASNFLKIGEPQKLLAADRDIPIENVHHHYYYCAKSQLEQNKTTQVQLSEDEVFCCL